MKMLKVDRILLGLLALGVWALVATTLLKTESVIAQDQRSRGEIESIIEGCGIVLNDPLDHGNLGKYRIDC